MKLTNALNGKLILEHKKQKMMHVLNVIVKVRIWAIFTISPFFFFFSVVWFTIK